MSAIPANSPRGKEIKTVAFSKEVEVEASQKMSHLTPFASKKSLGNESLKLFARDKDIEYHEKTGRGLQSTTTHKKEMRSRRALMSRSFTYETQIDKDDLVGNQVDILSLIRENLAGAKGRLKDKLLSGSFIAAVGEELGLTDSDGTADLSSPSINTVTKFRRVIFDNGSTTDAANKKNEVTGTDWLEDITYIFQNRDILDDMCCTLTPKLSRLLRKDSSFQDAENLYNIGKQAAANPNAMYIDYRGYKMVRVSKNVMPVFSANNVLDGTKVWVRSIKEDAAHEAESVVAAVNSSATQVSGTAIEAKKTVDASDMIYFWHPSKLYYATREQLDFVKIDERADLKYAEQIFAQHNMGTLVIDDDYVLGFALKSVA